MKRRDARLALIAAVVVGLALLAVFAIELSNTQAKSKADVESRVHERAVLAGALIDSLFQTVTQDVPQDVKTYGAATVSTATMNKHRATNAFLVLLNSSGGVIAASDGFNAQARADVATSRAVALGSPVRARQPRPLWDRGRSGLRRRVPDSLRQPHPPEYLRTVGAAHLPAG